MHSGREYSFLLGYYTHLITDGAFQEFIRNESRVKSVWQRIPADPLLCCLSDGYAENWDSVKTLIPRGKRMSGIYSIEAKHLESNPGSAYFTEILPLKDFPDCIDYLPHGCITRKIRIMGYIPNIDSSDSSYVAISKDEYNTFIQTAIDLILTKFAEYKLI